ncbi:MAG: cation transporter [Patescibacteria group bacterium]|nr:MAG: cation transporter [Patescibacteria group bacterium]
MLLTILRTDKVPSLGIGTIVGSAIFNILVITGASLLIRRVKLTHYPILRDTGFYIVVIVLLFFMFKDSKLTVSESIILLIIYLVYLYLVKIWNKIFKYRTKELALEEIETTTDASFISKNLSKLIDIILNLNSNLLYKFTVSIGLITLLTHLMIESALALANNLQISPAIIGLTILSIGTSIPDLLSSIAVAKRGYSDMAITNGIGSNIFDILIGIGLPYSIYFLINGINKTIYVTNENINASIALLFLSAFVILFVFMIQNWKTKKRSGALLILIYLGYLAYLVLN